MGNNNLINPASLVSFFVGIAAGLFICFLISGDPDDPPEVDISANLISNAEAFTMIDNHVHCTPEDSTISGHVELPILLGYINKMSNQCQSIGMEMSGLEYYFARYTNDPDNDDRPTILFYPTYRSSNGHVPFDPFSSISGSPAHVVNINNGNRRIATDTVRCVLDRSNMSPPRPPTY